MTDAEIAELLAAAEKATERPWCVDATKALGAYGIWTDYATHPGDDGEGYPSQICSMRPTHDDGISREQRDANAAYIVAACNIAPRLAEEVQRLRAALTAAREFQEAASASACEMWNMHTAEIRELREENERLKAALPTPEKRRSRLPPGNKRKLGRDAAPPEGPR